MDLWSALLATFALSLIWLRLNDLAAQRGWLPADVSRKVIHIGTGPIFILCWLFFPETSASRWLAALVPAAITLQFALVGLGLVRDPQAVRAMSRSGDRREILRGPLFYGAVFVALTLLYWRDSPVGIIALMLLCGGDGLADIVGRRAKSNPLPWNRRKSLLGSAMMFLGGFTFAAAIIWIYLQAGRFPSLSMGSAAARIAVIALLGTAVESLPLPEVDNLTVSLAAVLAGELLF